MKKTILKKNRWGFTLAELLAVLLILVILIGLGVTGFIALRRNIKIAEYDDVAREIYVAAQNQLTRLSANGMDKDTEDALRNAATVPFIAAPSDYDPAAYGEWKREDYRYAGQGADTMESLLPLGAVADDVRSNGFYIIEYNAQTYTVYGVFYSEKAFQYDGDVSADGFRTSREVRKGPMVGYYGGSAVARSPQIPLPSPELVIINKNELRLNIWNVPVGVTVSVKVSDGEKEMDATAEVQSGDVGTQTVLLDSMVEGMRFKNLFGDLTPGKDLTITVTYEKEGAIPSTASITANSLFATREEKTEGDTVTIAWARHLQNLEHSISNLDDPKITTARQVDHIWWEEGFAPFASIRNRNGSENYNVNLKRYEGSNLEIRDLTGANGLFALAKEGAELTGIRLVNPSVTAVAAMNEPVGALVGTAEAGTQISSCGVYYRKPTAGGAVDYSAYENCGIRNGSDTPTGGLVGKAENITVNSSFAALPVIDARKGATLIGEATGCTIGRSYANCDELPTSENFHYFLSGSGNTVSHSYAVGNVNRKEAGEFAHGNSNTVTDSYYAVSHRDWENEKDIAATEFYYYQLNGNRKKTNQENMAKATEAGGWAAGWADLSAPLTHPYRQYLDGRAYLYPAIGELDHYGSWPDSDGTVDLRITMRLLGDPDEYAIFAGKVEVTTVDEDGKETVLFDSDKYKDANGNFDTKKDPVVKVTPNTQIKVKITNAHGYDYVNTKILTDTFHGEEVDYTVEKDTEVVVTFQQNTFKLTCEQPKDDQGDDIADGTYLAVLGSTRVLTPPHSDDKVEAGTVITVQLQLPTGKKAGVVSYTANGENRTLVPNAQGNYTFRMPSADTTIHVQYTDQVAKFHVEYYVMDPETGAYGDAPTSKVDTEYAIGTIITQDVINILTDNSGRLLTIGDEKVLYLDSAELYKGSDTNQLDIPYDTKGDKNGQEFTVKIMIARARYTVTLVAGENIDKVSFKGLPEETGDTPKKVQRTYHYGKKLTAVANVAVGQNFTTWEPDSGLFRASSSVENSFEVPYFDLTLTARAMAGFYQVTLNLLENEESWLAGSDSRLADPIEVTLVDTKTGKTYPMRIPDPEAEDISFIAEAVVKSIPDLGEGYKIQVHYTKSGLTEFVKNADGSDVILKVRDRAVMQDVNFFTVTYYPNAENYRGTVPQGGTYLQFHQMTVPGNVGHLRNDDEGAGKVFAGWFDAKEEPIRQEVNVGDPYEVRGRVDFYVNWQPSLKVEYDANDSEAFPATGELPVDNTDYQNGETVTVKAGSLTRNGYTFLGWSVNKDAAEVQYAPDATFVIGEANVKLYAVWQWETYTLQFLNQDGTLKETVSDVHYGDTVAASDYPTSGGPEFLGWATDPGGDVVYRQGEMITVTGDQVFYPRFEQETVNVTYHYGTNNEQTMTVKVGKGISFYLNCDDAGAITAWRTEDSRMFYLCQDGTARSIQPTGFTGNIDLYAVTGKVYNFNRQEWYNTLADAVDAPNTQKGDTLIVYRDTAETKRIRFTEDLHVLANGNRRVTWNDYSYDNGDGNIFVGCMYMTNCTVSFGKSNIDTLSMDGGSLTFDANHLSRVMALNSGAIFEMYRDVTLTNGELDTNSDYTEWGGRDAQRQYCGGGVYADVGSEFHMYGGTISYCKAVRGGGVYLYGDKNNSVGSKMYMGAMEHPTAYSATAIHYIKEGKYYKNVDSSLVSLENYKTYYVATGNPVICYNEATNRVKILGNNFTNADGGGGLLMLDLPDGNLELYSGSIRGNSTTSNGGGIVTDGGGKVINGEDSGNYAELRIYEVDISHNSAAGYGGGIFQWQGVVYVYNSTIRENYAGINGGGIYLHHYGTENSDVDFYFGDISGNEAAENGGGVCVENGLDMWIRNGNLRENIAGKSGGGVYLEGADSKLYLSGGAIYDNKGRHMDPKDGSNEKYNDVSLNGGSAMTAMEGGLHLSLDNPGQNFPQIAVDGYYNGSALTENAHIVRYANSADFRAEDADLFFYLPNNAETNKLQVMPSGNETLADPLILRDPDNMKNRILEFYKNDGTDTAPVTAAANVGDVFTEFPSAESEPPFTREGYYIAGWARSPDAYEEDFVAYYDSTAKTWYMKYELVDDVGQWTNPGDKPTYTVDDKYDQKFYAMWKPHVVRYNLGSADASVPSLEDGVGPTVRVLGPAVSQFQKDGVTYTFRGWSTEENATVPDEAYAVGKEITLTDSDLTLYAVWRPSVVKITFDFNGGSDGSGNLRNEASVTRGQPLTIPNYHITQTGKAFAGWSKVKDADPDYQTGDTISTGDDTEDMTLYAFWKDIYKVTFHLTGGVFNGNEADRSKEVIQGEDLTLDIVPTRKGHAFEGWAAVENGEVVYDPTTTSITPTASMDLYAVWRAYEVTFDLNDGTITVWPEGEPSRVVKADDMGGVIFPTDTPNSTMPSSALTLFGWSENRTATEPEYPVLHGIIPDKDMTLYAVLGVEVTFDFNYEGAPAKEVVQVSKWDIPNFTVPVEDPKLDGYDFMGWKNDSSSALYFQNQEAPLSRQDTTFTARWAKPVTVTLMMNYGTESVFKSEKGHIGPEFPYTLPTEEDSPQRNGYVFGGWAEDPNSTTPTYRPGEQVEIEEGATGLTLYAVWEVTVTFDGNGVQYPKPEEKVVVGQSIRLPSDTVGSRVFLGWSTDPNAKTAEYEANAEFKPEKNTTLYAVWKSITLQFQHGSMTFDTFELPKPMVMIVGESTELPFIGGVYEGNYVLSGWSRTGDATWPDIDNGSSFMPTKEDPDPLVLYTVWRPSATIDSESPAEDPPSADNPTPTVQESPTVPETEAVTADPEVGPLEPQTWEVTFFLDGGEWMEDAMRGDEPLEDPLWDEKEESFTYTVPVGQDVMLLPPELEREGYVLDGWMWMDEEEPDPDKWVIYPAGEEIPITGNMKWIPVWIEEEQPTVEPEEEPPAGMVDESDPLPSEAPELPETEAPAEQATEPPKPQEPEAPTEAPTEPPTKPETEPSTEPPTEPEIEPSTEP